jgi:hypothetical protein
MRMKDRVNAPNRSEVAALIEEIDAQSRAAHAAMHEFREGAARHSFITARMEHTQDAAAQLIEIMGADAMPIIIAATDRALFGPDISP